MLQSQPVLVQALDGNWGNGWRVVLEHNQQVLREQRLSRPLKITSNRGVQLKFSAQGVPLGKNQNWLASTMEVCERLTATSQYQVVMASTGRVRVLTGEPKTPNALPASMRGRCGSGPFATQGRSHIKQPQVRAVSDQRPNPQLFGHGEGDVLFPPIQLFSAAGTRP